MSTLTPHRSTAKHDPSSPTLVPLSRPRQPRLFRYQPVPPVGFDDEGYPCEDSAAQEHQHAILLSYLVGVLGPRLASRAFVAMDCAFLYRKGDRAAVLAPDLLVAFGTTYGGERSYKLWEQPVPALVLEVLSPSTSDNDLTDKKHTYMTLGIQEYWLFDPLGKRVLSGIKGYRLQASRYQQVQPSAAGHFTSSVLGLELRVVEDRGWASIPGDRTLRFFDPATGEFLRSHEEERNDRLMEKESRQKAEATVQQMEVDLREREDDLRRMEARAKAAEAALRSAERQ